MRFNSFQEQINGPLQSCRDWIARKSKDGRTTAKKVVSGSRVSDEARDRARFVLGWWIV